jgi:hypothetical protein
MNEHTIEKSNRLGSKLSTLEGRILVGPHLVGQFKERKSHWLHVCLTPRTQVRPQSEPILEEFNEEMLSELNLKRQNVFTRILFSNSFISLCSLVHASVSR